MVITSAAGTHVGLVRSNNEDNFYIDGFYKKNVTDDVMEFQYSEKKRRHTYAICDGMGGEHMGEIAALKTLELLAKYDSYSLDKNYDEFVQAANYQICDLMKIQGGKKAGCTLSILTIRKNTFSLCNIGDSRIYLFRNDALEQLSVDHTRLQQLLDVGMTDMDHYDPSLKHILTQHLGIFPEEFTPEAHTIYKVPVNRGDIFLLCSDGLSDMIVDAQLFEIISSGKSLPPDILVSKMIDTALQNGGKDNISAVIVKVE